MTPLHYASQGGHKVIVEMLLNAGASTKDKNMYEDTALDLARANRRGSTAALLLRPLPSPK